MANIVYEKFLIEVVSNGVDLTLENGYKVCLIKGTLSEEIYNLLLSSSFDKSYNEVSSAGWECVNTQLGYLDDNVGYHEGGKYINFIKQPQIGYTEYYSSPIKFMRVTLDEDNAARYALIYRESDGLLISIFDLKSSIIVDDDSLILNWSNVPVLRLGAVDPSILSIDSRFSSTSENAVQNKVLTEAFKRYGIILENDIPPESEETFEDLTGMDERVKISQSDIDDWENVWPEDSEIEQ